MFFQDSRQRKNDADDLFRMIFMSKSSTGV